VIDAIVFDFLISFHITSDGVEYVAVRNEIGRNLGVFPFAFVRGHFQEICIAALSTLPMVLKPRHEEMYLECQLTDIGEMSRPKKRKNMRKT